MLNYSAIPVIVVICYIAITAIKGTTIQSKWYPVISCLIGAVSAIAMYYILPEFINASTLVAAIISGGVSGLAATGSNQVLKQLMNSAQNGTLVISNTETDGNQSKENNINE